MSAYKDKPFDVIIEEEIAELEALGIHPDNTNHGSNQHHQTINNIMTLYEIFRDKFLSTRRGLKHGGHSIIARGLYALQLVPWLSQFSAEALSAQTHAPSQQQVNNQPNKQPNSLTLTITLTTVPLQS